MGHDENVEAICDGGFSLDVRYAATRLRELCKMDGAVVLSTDGGRHRCVGAAFAIMQIKAIFSVLLREYEFEMAQPPESYRNDHAVGGQHHGASILHSSRSRVAA